MAFTTIQSATSDLTAKQVQRSLTKSRRSDASGTVFQVALLTSLLVALGILAVLLWTIWTDGGSVLLERPWDFLNGRLSRNAEAAGVSQGIRGTLWIAICTAVVSFPIGICAALYLEEYAPKNRVTSFIELNIRNLAGVPSVVYGILGLAVFVKLFNGFTSGEGLNRNTLLAAGLTLAVLVMPVIIITTQEAVRAVPQALREGAYGVGATKWEVTRTQVLPYAAPGILTGALLSMARAIGEAAPLILLGSITGFTQVGSGLNPGNLFHPEALFERFVAMPTVINTWVKQPSADFRQVNTAAAIIVLLIFVLLLNSVAILLRNRFEKKRS